MSAGREDAVLRLLLSLGLLPRSNGLQSWIGLIVSVEVQDLVRDYPLENSVNPADSCSRRRAGLGGASRKSMVPACTRLTPAGIPPICIRSAFAAMAVVAIVAAAMAGAAQGDIAIPCARSAGSVRSDGHGSSGGPDVDHHGRRHGADEGDRRRSEGRLLFRGRFRP